MRINIFFPIIAALSLGSCDDFPNKPELLNKFRMMGVGFDDPSYTYSTDTETVTATLSFYIASPKDNEISAENLDIESPQVDLTFGESELIEEKATLNIYKIDATATLPTLNLLIFNPEEKNTATVFYAAILKQGDEEERVLGKIKIYTPDVAAGSTVLVPTIDITSHSENDTISPGEITLKSELSDLIDEPYRTSWLVNSGVVAEFRRRETQWSEIGKGEKTVITTVRGLDTFNFNYKAIDLVAE